MRPLTRPKAAAGTRLLLPSMPEDLPPGYAPRTVEAPRGAAPHHRDAPQDALQPVPLSGPLTTVTSRSGTNIALHRADYRRPTPHGGFTIHGYAWRCTGCTGLSRGYEPRQFADAIRDARTHHCGDAS